VIDGTTTPLAMKLQYPSLQEQVAADFMALRMMSSMMEQPGGYSLGWLIDDVEKYVTSELDFTREAANAIAARDALASLAPSVLVPRVIKPLSSTRVITSEFVEGLVRLDDCAKLKSCGLEPLEVGRLVATAFPQLSLIHGLVHGDPHGGNVYCRNANGQPGDAPQLVILDHGLYHRLTDDDRLAICSLILECATPLPSRSKVVAICKRFAGSLAPLFPSLLSPAFAFSTGLSPRQLRAAVAGRLPEGTTLDDVWQTLVAMHDGESDVLGLLHSFGYVRGLQNALGYPERERVLALVAAATQATMAGRADVRGLRLQLALSLSALRVYALFLVLYLVGLVLKLLRIDMPAAQAKGANGTPAAATVDAATPATTN